MTTPNVKQARHAHWAVSEQNWSLNDATGLATVLIYGLAVQYSSASMIVMTRLVTAGSDESGECTVSVESK
jgi:hypothetical protein